MEIEPVPAKEKIVFTQDEVRQTRDIGSKLNGMAQILNSMVNGADKTYDDILNSIKELLESKNDVDKFIEQFVEQTTSLK